MEVKHGELEKQVQNFLTRGTKKRASIQEYYENAKGKAMIAVERPKSSIAEMIANNNKIQFNQTQQKLISHGSADRNIMPQEEHANAGGVGSNSLNHHEEYQNFTNQLIQYKTNQEVCKTRLGQQDAINKQIASKGDLQSHGYFKFTEILNSTNFDHFA